MDVVYDVQENKPLYSFEDNGDYVYDVAWSPIHPALFAAVDGTGRLDLWNLNKDTEVFVIFTPRLFLTQLKFPTLVDYNTKN
jgi:WD40 repeat protein